MRGDTPMDAMEDKIPVYVLDSEAKQFLVFKEHFDVFEEMQKHGAFDVMWGKVTLNFGGGLLQTVSVERVNKVLRG